MRDGLVALMLMLGGLGCILSWCICQAVVAMRAYRLRREADAIKMHVINGGRLPDAAPSDLAQSYLRVQWLGILGNVLLVAGILGVVMAQLVVS